MVHGKSYVGIVFNELFIIELFGQNIKNLRIIVIYQPDNIYIRIMRLKLSWK